MDFEQYDEITTNRANQKDVFYQKFTAAFLELDEETRNIVNLDMLSDDALQFVHWSAMEMIEGKKLNILYDSSQLPPDVKAKKTLKIINSKLSIDNDKGVVMVNNIKVSGTKFDYIFTSNKAELINILKSLTL